MSEIEKLAHYLEDNNYDYILEPLFDGEIIRVYEGDEYQWDVVCHSLSYGHEDGLLEGYGKITRAFGDVEGYLTADDVIRRL